MAYLDRDGVRIHYQTFGPPDGATPLLLTHGFSASSAMWQPNIEALAAARPVITWDLRGHYARDPACVEQRGHVRHAGFG